MQGLLVRQVATILGVHENTVRSLEGKGKLRACRDYRGYRVFSFEEVMHLKKQREFQINVASQQKPASSASKPRMSQ